MAITIDTQPQKLTPAYNDLYWMFSSDDEANDGFRYIVWLYINGTVVKKDKIVPMFSTLSGKYHGSRSISTRVSYHELFPIDSLSGAVSGLDKSYVSVKIQVGEEYFGNTWSFTAYGYAGTSTGWANQTSPSVNPGGWARCMLWTNTASPYSAGDIIEITLDDATTNSFLNGIHKVLDTFDSGGTYYVVLEEPWQTLQTPSTFNGTTTYADGRKTIIEPTGTGGVTSNTITVFNGAVPFKDLKDWDYTDWHCNDLNAKFLTSRPRNINWKVRPDSAIFIQYYNDTREDPVYMSRQKRIGGSTSIATYELVTSSAEVVQVDVSPVSFGSLTNVESILFKLTNNNAGTPTALSETMTFEIDYRCYEWDDVEIAFMDRLGSIMPFQFNLRKSKRMKSTKETYKKDVETTTMYDYELIDSGITPLNIEEDIVYTLRTEALNYDEANYLRELITSPFTVVRFGTGEYMRCNVLTSDLSIKESGYASLNYYTIEIELSNKDKVNW